MGDGNSMSSTRVQRAGSSAWQNARVRRRNHPICIIFAKMPIMVWCIHSASNKNSNGRSKRHMVNSVRGSWGAVFEGQAKAAATTGSRCCGAAHSVALHTRAWFRRCVRKNGVGPIDLGSTGTKRARMISLNLAQHHRVVAAAAGDVRVAAYLVRYL